jgi:hypothetical protein
MHDFKTDFYGFEMRALVLGYIRPELDYTSRGMNKTVPPRLPAKSCLSHRSIDRGYRG